MIHAGLRCSGSMLAAAAEFHQQHDDAVESMLQALRYQRLAGYSRSDYVSWNGR